MKLGMGMHMCMYCRRDVCVGIQKGVCTDMRVQIYGRACSIRIHNLADAPVRDHDHAVVIDGMFDGMFHSIERSMECSMECSIA